MRTRHQSRLRNRRPALAVLATALLLAPTACSSGSSGGSAQTTSAPARDSNQAQLEATRRFAACARTHGYPAFPDPVIDQYGVRFIASGTGLKQQMQALERVPECKRLFTAMRTFDSPQAKSTARPDAAVLQQLRRFALCVRQHGLPAFPDPASDGSFPVSGTGIGDPKRSPATRDALDACDKYVTGAAANFGVFT